MLTLAVSFLLSLLVERPVLAVLKLGQEARAEKGEARCLAFHVSIGLRRMRFSSIDFFLLLSLRPHSPSFRLLVLIIIIIYSIPFVLFFFVFFCLPAEIIDCTQGSILLVTEGPVAGDVKPTLDPILIMSKKNASNKNARNCFELN